MLYINTYLDKIGELIRGEADVSLAYELTDQNKILEMFVEDCRRIVELYRSGNAEYDEVKRNLNLLKSYVVSQPALHFERVKEFARSKGLEINAELEPEIVNEIALYINRVEKEL